MSTVLAIRPHWAMLQGIRPDLRVDLDVTGYQHADGNYTTISKYGDAAWNFSAYVRRANTQKNLALINFDTTMVDGKSLLDAKHCRLLDSSKTYIYARWMHQAPASRKFVTPVTLCGEWRDLKSLLDWMIERDIPSFSMLTSEVCIQYAKEVKADMADKGWGLTSAVKKLDIIYRLYEYREFLSDHPRQHPWPDQSAMILVGKSRRLGHYEATTEIIPRRIYAELGRHALEFVDKEGPTIAAAFDQFLSIREQALSNAFERRDYLCDRRRNSRRLENDAEIEATLAAQMRTTFPAFAQKYGFRDLKHFWSELVTLRTCCYVVCALFSGMRDSELCSLKVGCFHRSLGFDNEEYCWLAGTTYKLEADPKPGRWMVPEIVEKAVQTASRLAAPVNEQLEVELRRLMSAPKAADPEDDRARALRIIELTKLRGNLFVDWTGRLLKASAISNSTSNRNLKQVAKRFDLIVLPDDRAETRDRNAIKAGDCWPLATHQFRRTFAVFVARNMLGDVRYLRHHFKHWSIDMTLYYASDPLFDDSLLESALSARDELQATVLSDWLIEKKPLAGGRGPHIMQFRGRSNVKTAKNPAALVKAVGDGVFIRGTGHSWCLASSTGCGGEGLYDVIRCVKCSESVIDQSHLHIWKEIRVQQIETLSWPDMGIPSIERAKNHIREAESVLRDLGEPIEPYQFRETENDS